MSDIPALSCALDMATTWVTRRVDDDVSNRRARRTGARRARWDEDDAADPRGWIDTTLGTAAVKDVAV